VDVSIEDLPARIIGAVEDRDREGRERAARALLTRPALRPCDGEDYRLARRHADALRDQFARETGWPLVVDVELVRLMKTNVPLGPASRAIAGAHPVRGRKGDAPFTRRRYVLLCLALAVLERSDPQVALGRLAEQIAMLAREPGLESVEFTLGTRDERSDLVAAIRVLLGFGVLDRVAGDEDAYVSAEGDALYDVDRRVLSRLLTVDVSPAAVVHELGPGAAIDDLEQALHRQPVAFTQEETNRRLRHRLASRLLEDPVVYYDDLDDDERQYLVRQRVMITSRLADLAGLVPELRAEGIAMVDPDDQLTDMRMPEAGTDGHATLLLAEHLAAHGATDVAALRRHVRRLASEHAAYWRKTSREPGAEVQIVEDALARLTGLGLVRVTGDGESAVAHPMPALARFAVTAPIVRARETSR
jgi:uncharacterized protein (TIGR02678 family)